MIALPTLEHLYFTLTFLDCVERGHFNPLAVTAELLYPSFVEMGQHIYSEPACCYSVCSHYVGVKQIQVMKIYILSCAASDLRGS